MQNNNRHQIKVFMFNTFGESKPTDVEKAINDWLNVNKDYRILHINAMTEDAFLTIILVVEDIRNVR